MNHCKEQIVALSATATPNLPILAATSIIAILISLFPPQIDSFFRRMWHFVIEKRYNEWRYAFLAFVNISAFFDILKDNVTFTIQVPKKLLQVVRDVQRGTLVKLEKRSKFF